MSQKLAFAFCAGLIISVTARSANAALIGNATLVKDPANGIPFNAPSSALPAPWVSYQLSVQTTAGELIGAVDVTINGNKLHQRWEDIDFDGIVDPTPQRPQASDGRGDSHLTAPAGSPFGFGPTETNTRMGSPLTSAPGAFEYGVGNLGGAWALLAAPQATNIAYIVLKSTDLATVQITVKSATPAGVRLNDLYSYDFFPGIGAFPEPSTATLMSLALLGGTGFIRRRTA